MRGKVSAKSAPHLDVGITPAYAGKSADTAVQDAAVQDHPRLCGEKQIPASPRRSMTGSPPPMRGKGFDADSVGVCTGITPAYAGKRRSF